MAGNFKQGYYKPANPEKYIGNVDKIRYMSSWEYSLHSFLDNNRNIVKWGSEPIRIPYIKPTDGRVHHYLPDYYIEYIDKEYKLRKIIIEVKPAKQTKMSRARNPQTKLYEDVQYAVNIAKWQACKIFCTKNGFEFQILTEKQLYGK
jgi:hypothetical protein